MYVVKPAGLTLVSVSEAEDDAPLWSVGTTYNLGDFVIRNGSLYVSSMNANLAFDPALEVQELEGARWIFVSATNIRKFLDDLLSTATVGTSPLILEVEVDAQFNTVALFGLIGRETTVEVLNGDVVTDTRVLKTGYEFVDNWWDWLHTTFYNSARRHVINDVAGFAGAKVRITIQGEAPALGLLDIGRSIRIGKTLMTEDTRVRRKTYTAIDTNAFGVSKATKRAIVRNVTYSVQVAREGYFGNEQLLDELDGVVVTTFATTAGFNELINHGYLVDYELPENLPADYITEFQSQGVS